MINNMTGGFNSIYNGISGNVGTNKYTINTPGSNEEYIKKLYETQLELLRTSIKRCKKFIKLYKYLIVIYCLLVVFYTIYPFYKIYIGTFNVWCCVDFLVALMWIGNIWLIRRNQKKFKKNIIEYQEDYDKIFKEVDLPEYVRQKREKKLKRVMKK